MTIFSQDQEIIDGLKQTGSVKRKAEDLLFTRYQYFINLGQKQYALNEDDVFNAYSDTVLKAIANVVNGAFEGRSSLKTYMHSIFHNKCVDLTRKNSSTKYAVNRTVMLAEALSNLSDTNKSVIQKLIEQTDLQLLKNKLMQLGEKCRALLDLFLEGLNDAAIADKLAYNSADVVRTSRGRCVDKLRQS